MSWRVILLVAVATLFAACGAVDVASVTSRNNNDGSADGLWLLTQVEIDGQVVPIDQILFLEIEGNTVGGESTCNNFGGTFGGDFSQTAELCVDERVAGLDPMRVESEMIDAIGNGPELTGDRLVFTVDKSHFVYEPTIDPAPAEVFAVINDDTKLADVAELFVDPEGGQRRYDRLVRLDHSGTDIHYYLGLDGELVCFIYSTDNAAGSSCEQPRHVQFQTWAMSPQNMNGPVGPRVAFIPDHAIDAVSARPDVGDLEGNLLLIPDDDPGQKHFFDLDDGRTFALRTDRL